LALMDVEAGVDLDKMGDAARSLFEDGPDPILGGEPVTDDLGYGPATFVTPARVSEIAARYSGTTTNDLKRRFSPTKLMAQEAYPRIWDRPDEEPEVVVLADAVLKLYGRAEADGKGIFVALL
jgi:hypothetical protein